MRLANPTNDPTGAGEGPIRPWLRPFHACLVQKLNDPHRSKETLMIPTPVPDYDKDFLLLSTIDGNSHITQRDLSHRTGLSLGAVNLLLQKMIRDGLIKMETVPANRVIYVLTPKGLAEKAEKTVRYLRHHYQAILSTKKRIWRKLDLHSQTYDALVICLPQGELKDLVKMAVREYGHEHPGVQVKMVEREELGKLELANQDGIVLYLPEEQGDVAVSVGDRGYRADLLV